MYQNSVASNTTLNLFKDIGIYVNGIYLILPIWLALTKTLRLLCKKKVLRIQQQPNLKYSWLSMAVNSTSTWTTESLILSLRLWHRPKQVICHDTDWLSSQSGSLNGTTYICKIWFRFEIIVSRPKKKSIWT